MIGNPMRLRRLGLLLAVLLALVPATAGLPAFAQSSGGYTLPGRSGGSAPARSQPAFGGSGGYGRPPASSGGYAGSAFGGDRAISRRSSSDALGQYRTPTPSYTAPSYTAPPYTAPSYAAPTYAPRSYATPSYGAAPYGWAQSGRSFGVWDGLMLWGLLNTLSPSSTRFFQDNRNDPGLRQWRAQADQSAAQDPQLRARLDALDQQMAQASPSGGSGKPPPLPDTPPPPASPGGGPVVYIVLAGLLLFGLLWLWRRRAATPQAPAALRGSSTSRLRVGMTFPLDPTPFVLAQGTTKVRAPDSASHGAGLISVEAVGLLMDGTVPLHRLYLPGRDSFFLLHLGPDGRPDECRYFSRLDEVTPASRAEWGVWLDPAQGLIGWPQFQTRDGRLYGRVWSPGPARVAPRDMTETVQDLAGTTTRKLAIMLYGAPTRAASPAPATEYILVSAIDAAGEAFVEIHAGIDINPASLDLPAVPLS